jgi:exodeoxyribonuclease-3
VRIATWNVNSVGARLPRLLPWLEEVAPDVVALQETKCADAAFPYLPLQALGYEAAHSGDGRWNGVGRPVEGRPVGRLAVAGRAPGAAAGLGAVRAAARHELLRAERPRARDPHYDYKLAWFRSLRTRLDGHDPAQPLVVMGDLNVALHDRDVWDIGAFTHSTHVTPAERGAVQALLDWGLVDVAARPGKGDVPFTYWDYRAGMMHKNLGMRIDYVLASGAVPVRDAWVDREARKGKGASDHAPLVVDVAL